jgi:hypothetical protein
MSDGILQADSWVVTITIAVPVILGSLVAITIPGIISWGVLQLLGKFINDGYMTILVFTIIAFHKLDSTPDYSVQVSVMRYTYPITFCAFAILMVAFIIKKLLDMWMQTVRDDTYLIGKRLHNINNPQDNTA